MAIEIGFLLSDAKYKNKMENLREFPLKKLKCICFSIFSCKCKKRLQIALISKIACVCVCVLCRVGGCMLLFMINDHTIMIKFR